MIRLMTTAFMSAALALLSSCGSKSADQGGQTADSGKKGERKASTEPGKKGGKKPGPKAKEIAAATLSKLGSKDPDERSSAVKEAADAGEAGVKQLLAVLEKDDRLARTAALAALGRIGDKSAEGAVAAFLGKAGSPEEMLAAIEALGTIGGASSVPVLEKLLKYVAPVRFPPEAGFMVEKGRETEEGLVRSQAAESLARLGDFSGVPVLIDNLLGNGWVRKDAIIRLRKMTDCKIKFGYNIGDSQDDRAGAVEALRKWWAENEAAFKPEWTDSSKVFDLTDD